MTTRTVAPSFIAGRRARMMSTVCAASQRLAYPACNLDVTSREGLSTSRKRCSSPGGCLPGPRSASILRMSSLLARAARASSSSLLVVVPGSELLPWKTLDQGPLGQWVDRPCSHGAVVEDPVGTGQDQGVHAVAQAELHHSCLMVPYCVVESVKNGEA
eukprot:9464613-Pyramimonas_sp.AAC.1